MKRKKIRKEKNGHNHDDDRSREVVTVGPKLQHLVGKMINCFLNDFI